MLRDDKNDGLRFDFWPGIAIESDHKITMGSDGKRVGGNIPSPAAKLLRLKSPLAPPADGPGTLPLTPLPLACRLDGP